MAVELHQPLTATANYVKAAQRLASMDQYGTGVHPLVALDLAAQCTLRSGEIIRRMRSFVARGEVERRPEPMGKLIDRPARLAWSAQWSLACGSI